MVNINAVRDMFDALVENTEYVESSVEDGGGYFIPDQLFVFVTSDGFFKGMTIYALNGIFQIMKDDLSLIYTVGEDNFVNEPALIDFMNGYLPIRAELLRVAGV